jgi:phage-related holin
MKTSLGLVLSLTTTLAFVCAYFGKLAMDNAEQYFAVVTLIFMDGIFGIIAGTKREGFKTYKALKVIRTAATWVIILTSLLIVEKGFAGTSWLSETIIIPFIIFQLISILKNAATSGLIQESLLTEILKKIDQHKN